MKHFQFKHILIIILPISLISACSKNSDIKSDVEGSSQLHARAIQVDNISGPEQYKYIGGLVTRIARESDSANETRYMYSVTADANGYVNYLNLPQGVYYLKADTMIGGIQYTLRRRIEVGNDVTIDTLTLRLFPSESAQRGVVYTVTDALGNAQLNGVAVCLFASSLAANDNCQNSNYSGTTNPAGRVSFFNMPSRQYSVYLKWEGGSKVLKGTDVLAINTAGIVRKTISLQ